jgi:diguanylate cyclase (GGDEF)-like protein
VLYWSFRPLRRTAEHALRMAEGLEPMQPLAVKRLDEVGYLTTAFNTLLEKLVDTQAELRAVSRRDVLTGLSNRLDLADRTQQCIHRAQRHKTFLAALYMDLDNFKPVNDRLGHQAGDAALQEVARRLSALVREVDMLSRVGGDEFVLVLGDLGPTEDAARSAALTVASKCIAAMEQAMVLDGEAHQLGLSVGISVGDGNSTIDSLFSAADRAMYLAKKQGGNSYWVASADDPEGLGSPSGLGDI